MPNASEAISGVLAAAKAPGKRLGTPDPAGAVKRASEALRGEKLLSFHFVGLGI